MAFCQSQRGALVQPPEDINGGRVVKKYGVDKAITDKMNALRKEAETEIAGLDIQDKYRKILYELLEFSAQRRK